VEHFNVIFLTIGGICAIVTLLISLIKISLSAVESDLKAKAEDLRIKIEGVEANIVGRGPCELKHEEIDRRFSSMDALLSKYNSDLGEGFRIIQEEINKSFVDNTLRLDSIKEKIQQHGERIGELSGKMAVLIKEVRNGKDDSK
jgi:hypothetical protein